VLALADGEDPDARDELAANAAQRAGVRVVGVAFGTERGAPVPDGDAALQDARGKPVLTRRDATRLAALAAATDGASFAGDRWGDVDEAALLAALRRDAARGGGAMVERRVPATQVAPLAALAFALLVLELIGDPRVPLIRLRARRRGVAAALGVTLVLAATSLAADSASIAELEPQLRARPGDAALLVALGVARAERGHHEEAVLALRAAAIGARDPAVAAVAYFDLGVLEVQRRRFDAARDAFLDALSLRPDDEQARFNLEWTLRALRAEPPEPPPGGGESGDDPSDDETQREPAPGDEPDRATQDPADAPQPDDGAPARPRFAPTLGDDEVERWLSQIDDAATQALRAAAGSDDEPRASRQAAPAW
jgi:tetratricopeptide (TPR) repeat protein